MESNGLQIAPFIIFIEECLCLCLTFLLFQSRGCRRSWWRTRGAWGPTWGPDTLSPTWCPAPTWGSTPRTSRTSPRCWPPGTPTDSTCSPCPCPTRWVTIIPSESQWNESSTVQPDRKSNILSHLKQQIQFFLACIPLSLKAASRAWYERYPLRCDGPWTAWTTKLITISIWQGFFCKTWFRVFGFLDGYW